MQNFNNQDVEEQIALLLLLDDQVQVLIINEKEFF